MEKSAQTSLDSQDSPGGPGTLLLPIAEQEICLDCEMAAAASMASGRIDVPVDKIQKEEPCREKEACVCAAVGQIPKYGITYDLVEDLQEFSLLNISGQPAPASQQDECWWQNTLCSPLFPGSHCTGSNNI